jgi:diguanylate cyclase (GGDEF)-like protein
MLVDILRDRALPIGKCGFDGIGIFMRFMSALMKFGRAQTLREGQGQDQGHDQDLAMARLAVLSAQAPRVFAILSIQVLALSFTFINAAPATLTLFASPALLAALIWRAVYWTCRRNQPFPPEMASAALRRAHVTAALFGLAFAGWTMALYGYGDALLRSELVYAVAIGDIICIFALAQSPKTALMIGGLTLPGFLVLLAVTGEPSAIIVSVDLMLVAGFLASMVVASARDFEQLVGAQRLAVELAADNIRLANTDSLTGLANRREFFDALRRATAAEGTRRPLAIGVIDLDGFKPINDLYGHAVGDLVLRECAARVSQFGNDHTTIARLGGDEFGVVLRGDYSETQILEIGAEICGALRAPLRVADIRAGVSASIGFARYPHDGEESRQLYERADYALYFAKQHHRGDSVLFSPEHESKMLMTARIEQSLRRADFGKEITVAFQPLYAAADRSIVGFEALARWDSPELGQVAPDCFIPVAERGEIIHALTRTVIRKALAAAREWPDHLSLSFNLSIRDLLSRAALTQLVAIIHNSGFDPARIDIEVTETALISDFARAEEALVMLKRLGVKISLDDFGTGYSSLAYVHRLPLDRIKIDRSFVRELQGDGAARDIVRSMIALCSNLRLDCVIEGVETQEQFELLRSYGVNVVQGFLFSRPIAAADVAAFIKAANGEVERSA